MLRSHTLSGPEERRCAAVTGPGEESGLKIVHKVTDEGENEAGRIQIEQIIVKAIQDAIDALRDAPGDHRQFQLGERQEGLGRSGRVSGTEVSAAGMERMFPPLFTTKPLGLGTNLVIGRSIMEAHHCRVWVKHCADSDRRMRVAFALQMRAAVKGRST